MTTAQTVLMAVLPVVFCSVLPRMQTARMTENRSSKWYPGWRISFHYLFTRASMGWKTMSSSENHSFSIVVLQGWRRPVGRNRTAI
jgi:hypothetical protein